MDEPTTNTAPSIDWAALGNSITQWGRELGFDAVGIAGIDVGQHRDYLNAWLERGHHGEMSYMAQHGDMRTRPEQLHENARSVICARINYHAEGTEDEAVLASSGKAYVSRYALGRDYHKVVRGKLRRLATRIDEALREQGYTDFSARPFADSAPVLEKALAEQAGLGWIAKNTLLLSEDAGSWFFLGELLTNLPLAPSAATPPENRCGTCNACIDVCPTRAIIAPYQLDARLCISYLTIELKSAIPAELRPLIGNRVFGCDDCQIVCPWNKFAVSSTEPDFNPRHGLATADLLPLFQWTEEEFLERTEGSPIRRTGFAGWRRNLAVALGNSQATGELRRQVMAALQAGKGVSAMVDEHIDWAMARLDAD